MSTAHRCRPLKKSDTVTQIFLGLQEKNHLTAHLSFRPPQCTIPYDMPTLPQETDSQGPESFVGELCSRDFPHSLRHKPHGKQKAVFSLLTSEISSNHIGDDPPWPDPLSPGCGCPAHSGRGMWIHPRLIFIFLPLWAPCKRCVLPAVCKTEWQHCLNPL